MITATLLNIFYIFQKSTPTANNPWIGDQTEISPPVGWIIAGFLLLILVFMIYAELRKFLKRVLKRKK